MKNLHTYDEETERALRLLVVLTRCQASITAHILKEIQQNGLHASEFGVLEILYHKGDMTQSEIAERLLLATGSITYVMDKLVRQGWVVRVPCDTDRRVCYARLTPEGKEKIGGLFPSHAEYIREMLSVLTQEEQETLIPLLKKLGRTYATPRQELDEKGSKPI